MKESSVKRSRRSSVILWSSITLMGLLVVLSLILHPRKKATPPPEEKAFPVQVVSITPRTIDDSLRLPGRLEPSLRTRLATDKGGRVTEISADRGARVTAGQILLRIDDRVWRTHFEQAEIEWREAVKDFDRWEPLNQTGAVSAGEFDAVRARRDRAAAMREQTALQVKQCEVRSPVAGVINDRYVEVGEFAPEGAAVLELLVTDPMKLIARIPESESVVLQPGALLPFSVATLGSAVHTGTVSHVADAAAPQDNSFRVEALAPNHDGRLKGGMIATVDLPRGRRDNAIIVPLAAVIPRKGEYFVFLARDDRAERRLVRIDRIIGSEAVLSSGLAAGDLLIVEGHRTLVDGARIEQVNTKD